MALFAGVRRRVCPALRDTLGVARGHAVKLPRRKFLHLAAAAAALPVVSRIKSARAQDYPAKPIRIITHSAPGGSPDALLRIVGDRLSQM